VNTNQSHIGAESSIQIIFDIDQLQMKKSTSLLRLSNAFNTTIDSIEENNPNVPTKNEEWGFQWSFSFYESECDEVRGIDVRNAKIMNSTNDSSEIMPASMKRNLSFPSIGQIVTSIKEDALNTSNFVIEEKKQNSPNTRFDDTGDISKAMIMKRNFSFQSLVSVGKKALSLPMFHLQKVQKNKSDDENLAEMHQIFRDGNFVMVDGLILLESEEKRRMLCPRKEL